MAVLEQYLETGPDEGYIELDSRVAVLQDPDSNTLIRGIASTAIVEEFQPRVYKCSYRILDSPLDAEDATQETFIRVFDKIDSYQPIRPFGRWVLKIAKNQALSLYRYRSKRPQSSELDDYSIRNASRRNPEGRFVEEIEASESAKELLDKISPIFAAPLALREIDDLEYESIAQELGIPLGTVRSRIHRGKKQLQRLLEE